jgi:hypothetical protein
MNLDSNISPPGRVSSARIWTQPDIYTFSTLQQQFKAQKNYDQLLMVHLYVFLSAQRH